MAKTKNVSRPEVDVELMVLASEMYYLEGKTQQEIADALRISRAGVSGVLSKAREEGIAAVSVRNPMENFASIEKEMKERFGLNRCSLTVSSADTDRTQLRIAYKTSELMPRLVRDNDVIGTGRGNTVRSTVDFLRESTQWRGLQLVPLTGETWFPAQRLKVNEISSIAARKLDAVHHPLNAPLHLQDPVAISLLREDESVRLCTSLWDQLSCALFGIGAITNPDPYHAVRVRMAESRYGRPVIADLFGRFIDADGKEITEADLLAVQMSQLANAREVIAAAGGRGKERAILAALRTGLITTLVTDEDTALGVMALAKEA